MRSRVEFSSGLEEVIHLTKNYRRADFQGERFCDIERSLPYFPYRHERDDNEGGRIADLAVVTITMMRTIKAVLITAITVVCSAVNPAGACPLINGLVDFNCDGKHRIVATGDSIVFGVGD